MDYLPCNANSTRHHSRGCRHSLTFRLPRSLGPPIAPTAVQSLTRGGRAVYTTHSSVGYLLRDVVSLRVRHEQLTRRDFHPLDYSLVGCSPLLEGGPSQRYLRESFPRCLHPYPGGPPGAYTRFFPGDIGLHHVESGSALNKIPVRQLLYGIASRGCSDSFMFRPPGLLATQVAPTASRFYPLRAAVASTSPHISVCYLPEQGIC